MTRSQHDRAPIIDANFSAFVTRLETAGSGAGASVPESGTPPLSDSDLTELFESQATSRHLDLLARQLRRESRGFYTIGSAGHEGNALLGRLTRPTDPAMLHYRSGAFMAERARHRAESDFIHDTLLSLMASADDPASGGRHKVWGSRPLWVIPQTSTIGSHLPKAVGMAIGLAQLHHFGNRASLPEESIVICSFGDASVNHSTAQGAFNAAQWAAHQGLPVPLLFVCEDNGLGLSVPTPRGWIERSFSNRPGLHYIRGDGLDLATGYAAVHEAVDHCRHHRAPTFLHLECVRLMGHAGTDVESTYRAADAIEQAEARDPLLRTAWHLVTRGLLTPGELLERYEAIRTRCRQAADALGDTPRLDSAGAVTAPLTASQPSAVDAEARREADPAMRQALFGTPEQLPEQQPARHLAVLLNWVLQDLMVKYPEALLFGEDVAKKGGVYTITRGLLEKFHSHRVFNTLLDETTILGLAQGYALLGMLPIPEIQYLAFFHNAFDQVRGEAASLQFFSNGQFRNPMVIRIAGLGYQKGFGGHFHNDNAIAALRDIPGIVLACPSRGDDAVGLLRTLAALAMVEGKICIFLEPIALYMTKDLHEPEDNAWCFRYPPPPQAIAFGEPRLYHEEADELLIITYGNGVPMSLRVAREIRLRHGRSIRIMDLRWLQPLNSEAIVRQASTCQRVLVVDEGRRSGGIGEGIIAEIVEALETAPPVARVAGENSYIPLGDAAHSVLPSEASIRQQACAMLGIPG